MNQQWLDWVTSRPKFESKIKIFWNFMNFYSNRHLTNFETLFQMLQMFNHVLTWFIWYVTHSHVTVLHHLTHLTITWSWWFMYFVAFTEPFWLHLSFLFDHTFDVISRTYVTTWCLCGIFLEQIWRHDYHVSFISELTWLPVSPDDVISSEFSKIDTILS